MKTEDDYHVLWWIVSNAVLKSYNTSGRLTSLPFIDTKLSFVILSFRAFLLFRELKCLASALFDSLEYRGGYQLSGKFNAMSNRSFLRDGKKQLPLTGPQKAVSIKKVVISHWQKNIQQLENSRKQSAWVLVGVDIIYPLPYQSTCVLVLGDTGSWLTVFWDMHCGHTQVDMIWVM